MSDSSVWRKDFPFAGFAAALICPRAGSVFIRRRRFCFQWKSFPT